MKTNLLIPALVFFNIHADAQFHQDLTFNGVNNVVDCGNMATPLENVSANTTEERVAFNSFS